MKSTAVSPHSTAPVDADLAKQAKPGHGIPSQDPDAAAQRPLQPHEQEREAKSTLMGGGMVAGVVTGAAIGVVVGGPVGVVVGATVGAVAGAIGGAAAGATAIPKNEGEPEDPTVLLDPNDQRDLQDVGR